MDSLTLAIISSTTTDSKQLPRQEKISSVITPNLVYPLRRNLLRRSVCSSMFFTRIWKTNIQRIEVVPTVKVREENGVIGNKWTKGIKQFENTFLEACFLHAQKRGRRTPSSKTIVSPISCDYTYCFNVKMKLNTKGFSCYFFTFLSVTLFLFWERKKYSNRTREN